MRQKYESSNYYPYTGSNSSDGRKDLHLRWLNCDGSTAKTLADGTMIESTFVTAPIALTVIDMGDTFILSDLAATAVVASPTLNARGMAFRGNNGFAKDRHGYYVTSPGIINAALNCRPVVKS